MFKHSFYVTYLISSRSVINWQIKQIRNHTIKGLIYIQDIVVFTIGTNNNTQHYVFLIVMILTE